jgi:rod shape-determining protein MreB
MSLNGYPSRSSRSHGLRSLFSMFSSDLAIDLGTANTLVFAAGKGIVVNEPSIVAINKNTGEVEAVGKDAKEMLGRTPGNIVAIKPMKDGVIADFKVTEKMLNYFIQKAHNRKMLVHPRIVIGVPSEITQVEKRAVEDSAYRAKASEVYLVEQAMVAAIGAGLADYRTERQHGGGYRWRDDGYRCDFPFRDRLFAVGADGREPDGRGHYQLPEAQI